ncbi:MAG: trigger factor [Longimicrobiales bacterium]
MATETIDLKIDIEEPRSWSRRLIITVPAGRVDRERKAVLKRLADRVRLPGFRRGKVPQGVLQRQFGATIQHETVERVVDSAFREALQEKGLRPITQGEVEDVAYEPGSDLRFQVHFEIRPDVELKRIGGFRVQRQRAAVADADVDRVLERLRSEQALWEPLEAGAPSAGDSVAVEITPLAEPVQGSSVEPRRYDVVLGEGQALPDVESAIQTLTPGEAADFTIHIPAAEESALPAADEQRVRIALLEAKRPKLPALDDEFARAVGDFGSLDELRQRVREDLEREADTESESQLRRQLLDEIIEANPFEVPDSMAHAYLERVFPAREGMDAERLREMRQLAQPAAARAIQRTLVIERVADMEGLRVAAPAVDARIDSIAERTGRPAAEIRAQLQRSGHLESIEEEILEQQVFEYLKSISDIVD